MILRVPDPGLIVQGIVLTLAVAGAARWFGAVSSTGFWAGLAVGGWVSLGFGSPGLAVVGTFFLAGVLATRWRYAEKKRAGMAEPGEGARGAGRVLAKGAIGAALAAAALLDVYRMDLVRAAFVGAFAAAAADTLGTEMGQVLGRRPFTLIPPRAAKPGTPGAISGAGLACALLGSVLVATVAARAGLLPWEWVPAVAAAGLLGSVVESLLAPVLRSSPFRHLAANLATTASGAALAAILAGVLRDRGLPS